MVNLLFVLIVQMSMCICTFCSLLAGQENEIISSLRTTHRASHDTHTLAELFNSGEKPNYQESTHSSAILQLVKPLETGTFHKWHSLDECRAMP